jgi:hypothetical protein
MASMVLILGNISLKEEIAGPETIGHAISDFKREMLNQLQVLLAKTTKNLSSSYDATTKFQEFLTIYQQYAITSLGINFVLNLYTDSFFITYFNNSMLLNITDGETYFSSVSARILIEAQDIKRNNNYYGEILANYTTQAIIRGNNVELLEYRYSSPVKPVIFARVTSTGIISLNTTSATSQLDNGVYTFDDDPTNGFLNATLPNGVSIYST